MRASSTSGCVSGAVPPGPRGQGRRTWLPFVLACGLLLAGQSPASSQVRAARVTDERPNILVILADDLGYRDVSFQGATEIETPHIDRLARAGVIFSNGYVAHALCAPSRAGLMTGRYPARFGDVQVLQHLPVEERTVADYLREAGYRTGIVGKWHLGTAPEFHPLNRGFDYFYGFTGSGHDYFRIDVTESPLQEYLLPLNDGRGASGFSGYLTDALTDRAIDFVAADREEPFFLYLSYNAPHVPLQAPAETVRKYRHVDDEKRRRYLAMIDSLDHNVGRIVAALQAAGRWENTLTFFLSDNGGDTFKSRADNRPLRNGKGSVFEGGIRVPFAASWPARWSGGTTFEPMVISLDVAATALALAGDEATAHLPLDGVNLDPFMRGEASGVPHEALFWKVIWNEDGRFAVRKADAKLVSTPWGREAGATGRASARALGALGGGGGLFDLSTDPGETRDLIAAEAGTAARLTALWNDWNERTSAAPFGTSHQALRYLIREMYRATVAGEPVVRSTFDVYLDGARLTYVREPCRTADTRERFFLHLFPAYSAYGKRHGFENLDFDFWNHGVILDGRCLAVVTLPEHEITGIRTGQYIPGTGWVWGVEFPVGPEPVSAEGSPAIPPADEQPGPADVPER